MVSVAGGLLVSAARLLFHLHVVLGRGTFTEHAESLCDPVDLRWLRALPLDYDRPRAKGICTADLEAKASIDMSDGELEAKASIDCS